MERIQSAIEKARLARQQQSKGEVNSLFSDLDDRPALRDASKRARAEEDTSALWTALPEFSPSPRRLKNQRIVAPLGGVDATPFDVMRTKLLYQLRQSNWRRVAVTSPGMACGKTTTCLNLAFSLSRQPEVRTMLVELDMRRPSIASTIGFKEKHDFSKVLEGETPADEHMIRIGKNLAIATHCGPVSRSAEILQGVRAAAVLDELEERYQPDIMIFDMPPMLVSDDTIAFLDQVDCVLLVGAAEKTTIDEIEKCESDIASRTNMLGVVLNMCRHFDKAEGYGYY